MSHFTWNTGWNRMVSQTYWIYFRYPLFKERVESVFKGEALPKQNLKEDWTNFISHLKATKQIFTCQLSQTPTVQGFLGATPDECHHPMLSCVAPQSLLTKLNCCQNQPGVKRNHVFTEERLLCRSFPPKDTKMPARKCRYCRFYSILRSSIWACGCFLFFFLFFFTGFKGLN